MLWREKEAREKRLDAKYSGVAQEAINEFFKSIETYDPIRDKEISWEIFPDFKKYMKQIGGLARETVSPLKAATIIDTSNFVGCMIAGEQDIVLGDISVSPKGIREHWESTKSSIDLSDGAKMMFNIPGTKKAFVFDIPKEEVETTMINLEGLYRDVRAVGQESGLFSSNESMFIGKAVISSIESLLMASSEEQKETFSKMKTAALDALNNLPDEKKEELALKLQETFPKKFKASVREENGTERPIVKEDVDMFYNMIMDTALALDDKKAINLGKIAGESVKKKDSWAITKWVKSGMTQVTVNLTNLVAGGGALKSMGEKYIKPQVEAFVGKIVKASNEMMKAEQKELQAAKSGMERIKQANLGLQSDRAVLEAARSGQNKEQQVTIDQVKQGLVQAGSER